MKLIALLLVCLPGGMSRLPPATTPTTLPDPINPLFEHLNRANRLADSSKPDCNEEPNSIWLLSSGVYYTVLTASKATYATGLETCRLNYGMIAKPCTLDRYRLISEFTSADPVGLSFLGLHLPMDQPDDIICNEEECNDYLKYSDGSPFIWHKWMGKMFNRVSFQPRCFAIVAKSSQRADSLPPRPIPINCYDHLTIICQAYCPTSGPPTQPPPPEISDNDPVVSPFLVDSKARMIRTQSALDPRFKDSQKDFLNPDTGPPKISLADSHAESLDPNFGIPPVKDQFTFAGYDCSAPRHKEPLQIQPTHAACNKPSEPIQQRNASYLLLQKVNNFDITVQQCRVTDTILPFHCGRQHAMTIVFPWLRIEQPYLLSEDQCRELWQKGVYVDPNGKEHEIRRNDTNRVYFFDTGGAKLESNTIYCEVDDKEYEGDDYYWMVVQVARRIDLFTQPAQILEDFNINILRLDTILDSKASDGYHISSSMGTFIWKPVQVSQVCRHAVVRRTSGILIADKNGVETYMSQDGSLLRLLVGKSTSRCSHIIHETNYDKLFLSSDLLADRFLPKLPLSEYSFFTYSDMMDGWLFGELTSYIREEFQSVHEQYCRHLLNQRRTHFDSILAEQHAALDGDTAALGGGNFVTVAGETWYQFQCRRILVTARPTLECYASLPVQLSPTDLRRFLLMRGLSVNSTVELFLEPHSRRLTTRGIQVDCSDHFPALYKNVNGRWLSTHPHLAVVDDPRPITSQHFRDIGFKSYDEVVDFEHGGIYTPDDITNMEKHLTSRRAVKDVSAALGKAVQERHWFSGPPSPARRRAPFTFNPDSLLAPVIPFPWLWHLWDTLIAWAQAASAVWLFYHIVQLFVFCYRWLFLPTLIPPWARALRRIFIPGGHAYEPPNPHPSPPPSPPPGLAEPPAPAQIHLRDLPPIPDATSPRPDSQRRMNIVHLQQNQGLPMDMGIKPILPRQLETPTAPTPQEIKQLPHLHSDLDRKILHLNDYVTRTAKSNDDLTKIEEEKQDMKSQKKRKPATRTHSTDRGLEALKKGQSYHEKDDEGIYQVQKAALEHKDNHYKSVIEKLQEAGRDIQQQQSEQIQTLKDITTKLKDQLSSSEEELNRIELEQLKMKEQHQNQQDEMKHENQQLKQQIEDLVKNAPDWKQQKKKKKTPSPVNVTSPKPLTYAQKVQNYPPAPSPKFTTLPLPSSVIYPKARYPMIRSPLRPTSSLRAEYGYSPLPIPPASFTPDTTTPPPPMGLTTSPTAYLQQARHAQNVTDLTLMKQQLECLMTDLNSRMLDTPRIGPKVILMEDMRRTLAEIMQKPVTAKAIPHGRRQIMSFQNRALSILA